MGMIKILGDIAYKGNVFFPRTVSDAVVYQTENITVTEALDNRISNIIVDDSLTVSKDKTNITLGHSNQVSPNILLSPKLFTYDEYGHITGSEPVESLNITIDGEQSLYNGTEEINFSFGDDFIKDQFGIKLNFNNLDGTT